MSLNGITSVLNRNQGFRTLATASARPGADRTPELLITGPSGMRSAALAQIASGLADPAILLVTTATGREAEDLTGELSNFLPAEKIALFPAWETLPHERLSPRSDTVGQRLKVLRRLAHPETSPDGALKIVVAPIRSLLQPLVKGLGELAPVELKVGDEHDFNAVLQQLSAAAYSRVDMVAKRGEFAVRGGMIDVFPPTESHPIRVEFFGDEVDQMRYFSIADQRTLLSVNSVEGADAHPQRLYAPPCREMLITPSVQSRAAKLKNELPGAADMLEKIAGGIAVEGMESLAPVLVDGMEPLSDVLPENSLVLCYEPERVRHRAHDLVETNEEFLHAAWESAAFAGAAAPVDTVNVGEIPGGLSSGSFATLAQLRTQVLEANQSWWQYGVMGMDLDLEPELADANSITLPGREPKSFGADLERLCAHVRERAAENWQIVVATEGPGSAQRLGELFVDEGISVHRVENLDEEPPAGLVTVTTAVTGHGFASDELKFGLLSEADVLGRSMASSQRSGKTLARKRRNAVDPLTLKEGDYVVHEQHGIAKFVELQKRRSGGIKDPDTYREYLVLEYAPTKRGAPGDRLFVPTDQLDQVTLYVGGDAPALSKMGGSDWANTKSKAKRAVKEIAGELIRLYSARMASRGHAFAPDSPWQRELEEAFPFIETPDQLTTIHEVKEDMEKDIPMDRLISGDVGFGKTEVAVRAAFKAVQDGKQVAMLVPTTLLAKQHFETFTERFSGFPVRVRSLSRFQTAKESKEILSDLKDGKVDVIIGTHRLLGKEVQFKDLGLVIIDEEQRFGVEHKEALKKLRTNVDVLAMSATPIPRTLEMSLTGIRETSTLATAPEERHPVLTYVGAYTDRQVTAAIRRELMREGQVFYVHNRVSSIDKVAAQIRELVPEARVEVAHGKMSEARLEQIIVDFWEKRFDVLVSTTIIETGLDISNANTLIVDRADAYGLSQLHQLRGRVGRGRERAYAYFLYDAGKHLNETALERLKAVAAHNELGSGMQLAMKDLELRGAGNLLGGEQSGHIAGVGFDLYIRMVGEAVADFKAEDAPKIEEVKVELPINAHLPHDYVPGERLRLEAYRNLAQAYDEQAIEEVIDELKDRYGTPPEPVENLLGVARLRNKARALGVHDIALMGKNIKFSPAHQVPESRMLRLARMYPKAQYKKALDAILIPKPMVGRLTTEPLVDAALLEWTNEVLDNIFTFQLGATTED
ncbi:transcription-repair coupling factor [Micrococcoides hystricis]|uniref:Transcription-repair-coupling factor n=1 Tax=Micrococcoides hystricis TaxID=1572761 RepID=A0ABV6PAA7_9MICC